MYPYPNIGMEWNTSARDQGWRRIGHGFVIRAKLAKNVCPPKKKKSGPIYAYGQRAAVVIAQSDDLLSSVLEMSCCKLCPLNTDFHHGI